MAGWQQDTGLLDLVNGLPVRPRPQPVLFAPGQPVTDPTDDQNTGTMLPDLQGSGGSSVRNFPVPSSIANLAISQVNSPLDGPMRGATNAASALRGGRPSLAADLQGSQGPRLPQIFNAGAQSSPDIAIPATGGTPPGPGYRRTISNDGGPSFWQQVRPEERGVSGQDLLRQGTSAAEIAAAHPGWSATQQIDLYRQLQQDAMQASRQNFALGNQTANRNAGIRSNADDVAIRGVANDEKRTGYTTGGQAAIDQAVNTHIAANPGATAEDIAELTDAIRRGRTPAGSPGSQPASGNWPIATTGQPAVLSPATDQAARNPIHRELDQHLGNALVTAKAMTQEQLASRRGAGSRVSLTMPATTNEHVANDAITNFVSSIGGAGHLTPDKLPEIMSYMNQRFGPANTNRWFQQRFGGLYGGSDAHQEGVNAIINAAGERGVNVGYRDRSGDLWHGGLIGSTARAIHNLFR